MRRRRVELISKQRVFDGFFKIDEYRLRHETFDGGMTPELPRLVFLREDAVAAVLWNRDRRRLILVEQFRPPLYANGEEGWTVELPAGLMDQGSESREVAMRRELLEETGYRASVFEEWLTYYPSPGGSRERLTLFYAEVGNEDRVATGGGEDEGEDLHVVEWTRDELAAGIRDGRIVDGKTIIGVQWFLMKGVPES